MEGITYEPGEPELVIAAGDLSNLKKKKKETKKNQPSIIYKKTHIKSKTNTNTPGKKQRTNLLDGRIRFFRYFRRLFLLFAKSFCLITISEHFCFFLVVSSKKNDSLKGP
jgi:hypothetical protein